MRNKVLLLTLIAYFFSFSPFTNASSQSYNENDKEGLRKFLRQQSSVSDKTNIECLGFNAVDTINWYSSEEWLQNLQIPKALAYIDWTWDMSLPSRLTHLEFKSFDDSNTQLSGFLDCNYFTELEYLDCSNSRLNKIDIFENFNLKYLNCSNNNLTYLNTIQANLLSFLDCSNNKLADIDLSMNFNLTGLNCSGNNLEYLNTSGNHNIINLSCANNKISNIILPKSPVLESLDCSDNNISDLSLTMYRNLKLLSIDNNQIKNINISDNKDLVALYTEKNDINSIESNSNSNLTVLNAAHNKLDEINLNYTPQIEHLYAQNNLLENVNTASAPNLREVNLSNNQLSDLDLSNNPLVTDLNFSFNNVDRIYTSVSANPFLSFVGNDNYLRFSTLPLDLFNSSTQKLIYSPQDTIDMGEILYRNPIDLTSELKIKNTTTTYEWFNEDGSSATFDKTNEGIFMAFVNDDVVNYCRASNSLLPDLSLVFKVKTLKDNDISITKNQGENHSFYYDKSSQSIHILNPDLVKSINIFDTLGRIIHQQTQVSEKNISVQRLPTGVYIIKVNLKSGKNLSQKISI